VTQAPQQTPSIKPIAFEERPGREPYNASEIVAIEDGRFLFCDNNIGAALFELRLAADGSQACPIVKHPLEGIEADEVDDLEGLTAVTGPNGTLIYAMPSLSLKRGKMQYKKRSERGKTSAPRSGLLRISLKDERLEAELLLGFREWLVDHAPILGKFPRYLPDDGGLNVEGLGYSPADRALLLGVRTPVVNGRPLVLRVRIAQPGDAWELSSLEMLPPLGLAVDDPGGEQGIRTIGSDGLSETHLVVAGNSTSRSKAPFTLWQWDGNAEGRVRCFPRVRFHKRMKVEGVTHGTVGGRDALIFVDDAGGYQLLWADDPRLEAEEAGEYAGSHRKVQ
jgi:hypothetical protein